MYQLILTGGFVSFFLGFLFVGPADFISQITYGVISVVIYGVLVAIAAKVFPGFRKKKDGVWLALSVSVLSFSILYISFAVLYARVR